MKQADNQSSATTRPNTSKARQRLLTTAFVAITCILAGLTVSPPATAQDVQRIAAVVNEKVISVFDVQQRMRLLISSSGLPNNAETQRRIAPQVLRELIDEALQNQEAERLNIRVTQREIDSALEQIESTNNLPAGGFESFINRQGISLEAALSQIRSNVAWQKLLVRTVLPTIEIGDEEINDVISRIKATAGITEYRVGEILLPIDNPSDAADIDILANRLVKQLRDGADFRSVAQQFSKSATAATGGDIGWVQQGELGPTVDDVITKLERLEISDPIKVPEGMQIIILIDQRTNEPPDPNDRTVALRQMLLSVAPDAPPGFIEAQLQTARAISSSVRGCADFAAAATEAGSPQPAAPATFKLKDLNAELRTLAAQLDVDQASAPIRVPSGVQVLMICDRQEDIGPDRDVIRRTLKRERIDMLSRRYLRDLRRSAFVDLRV
ncbi:MAG: peptidylprolyl isomerase [Alphaproteobacteria bacterium]